MKAFAKFVLSSALGIFAGVIAFFIWMLVADLMPQQWFGTCFEGSCGYAAGLIGLAISLPVSMVVTIRLLVRKS